MTINDLIYWQAALQHEDGEESDDIVQLENLRSVN